MGLVSLQINQPPQGGTFSLCSILVSLPLQGAFRGGNTKILLFTIHARMLGKSLQRHFMAKDYSKMSRRSLEVLEFQLGNDIIRLRDKYQDTKAEHEKELKALKRKAEREIEAFKAKMNKEVSAFEDKGKRELEAIKKQGSAKVAERQKVNEALNQQTYTKVQESQKQEPKEVKATPPKQEGKETHVTPQRQEAPATIVNPAQPTPQGQDNHAGFGFKKPS